MNLSYFNVLCWEIRVRNKDIGKSDDNKRNIRDIMRVDIGNMYDDILRIK